MSDHSEPVVDDVHAPCRRKIQELEQEIAHMKQQLKQQQKHYEDMIADMKKQHAEDMAKLCVILDMIERENIQRAALGSCRMQVEACWYNPGDA